MDTSTNVNSVTDMITRALSGLPPQPAETQQGTSTRATFVAGIPLVFPTSLLSVVRALLVPLGINVYKLWEQTTSKTDEGQGEAGAEDAKPKSNCPICLGAYVRPTAIKACGHVFCGSCIAEAIQNEKKCPTCRTKATKRHLLKIFLS